MRVGIISAMQSENDLILSHMDQPVAQIEKGMRDYVHGNLWGVESVIVVSRIGKVAATMTATQLIAEFQPDLVLFTGVAGALHKNLNVGDIVIASALMQHDMDASPLFPRYEIPLLGLTNIVPDRELNQMVKEASTNFLEKGLREIVEQKTLEMFQITSPKVVEGVIGSGDQFLSSREENERLSNRLPEMSCIEMEGAAIGQVCHEYGIPFSIIRTISDSANDDAMTDFKTFLSSVASHYSLGILKELYPRLSKREELALEGLVC
ncbi:MAG: 5'-methylthioadenosine/S-adenosylhomocysteine nucleosidase [Chlamydiales bacterium]|nr:5'-methylthioadenosine/S-adenosylhomocysteine nucleosidase [Chlamydiales bacterium]MCH9619556.1 5'-methylthioadenosine/S-adenosylhomocysteine nucleosidase [Chlamydiales bacterium]MCH9623162.1 5'-methylthioadenosine/S-adenosylhomocysteine nucleosidase [Chlamydiales bacterium]